MVCFLVENVTSILENLSCIDGKDKSYYIDLIMDAVGIAFKKIGLKKDKGGTENEEMGLSAAYR
jgi:hypothetical protein